MVDPFSSGDSDRGVKQRLIDAGLEIFGTYNLEGATTRQLAEQAGVNQAAIPYYFGGKEGLYNAAIQHIFSANFALIQPVLGGLEEQLTLKKFSKTEALAQLKGLLDAMMKVILTRKASSTWARIIMREQMQPTQAFDFIYNNGIRRLHTAVSTLLAVILKRKPTDRILVLRAHMLIGQVLIFLAGRETIRRRLDLKGYTDDEVTEIRRAFAEQLDLLRFEAETGK